jgi:DNA-binding NarL/FixJ family response regulator
LLRQRIADDRDADRVVKSSAKTTKPSRGRVFLVDDHPLVREWLASLIALEPDLEVCGQAEEVSAALASIPLARPHVVVVDLSLPRSSGLELIKDLRAQFPALRLLVLSMLDDVSVAERAFRAGAHGYAIKRESGPQIVAAIRSVLGGKFYASATLSAQLAERRFAGAAHGGQPEELLSDRELEVFRLRGQGHNTKQIAEFLRVGVKTVGSYDTRIKLKLGLENAGALLRAAVRWNDRQNRV